MHETPWGPSLRQEEGKGVLGNCTKQANPLRSWLSRKLQGMVGVGVGAVTASAWLPGLDPATSPNASFLRCVRYSMAGSTVSLESQLGW